MAQRISGKSFEEISLISRVNIESLREAIVEKDVAPYGILAPLNRAYTDIANFYNDNGKSPARGPAAIVQYMSYGPSLQVWDEMTDNYETVSYVGLLEKLELDPVTITVGDSNKGLALKATPEGSDLSGLIFKSSDTKVATIVGEKVHAVKAGTATITATVSGVEATAKVTVKAKPAPKPDPEPETEPETEPKAPASDPK